MVFIQGMFTDTQIQILILICLFAFLLGILFVIPIGGADMPVVIALLNSFSGLAACAAGFVVGGKVPIVVPSPPLFLICDCMSLL